MSSTLDVYAVEIQRIKQVVGSQDQSLLAAIVRSQARLLARTDEIDDEAELKCSEALAHIINGAPFNKQYGYLYGYALMAICAQTGTDLPNVSGIVGATDWIESVDAFLGKQDVPVKLQTLVFGGSPIRIPTPDDYPCIGQWPADILPRALEAIGKIDFAKVDDEVAETGLQMQKWLQTATKNAGTSLVGFLY